MRADVVTRAECKWRTGTVTVGVLLASILLLAGCPRSSRPAYSKDSSPPPAGDAAAAETAGTGGAETAGPGGAETAGTGGAETTGTGGAETTGTGGVAPCAPCESDADCGDLACATLGGGNYCLASCYSNNDCQPGWKCYGLGYAGNRCIPILSTCETLCLGSPCPSGQVCSQESGECVSGGEECSPCKKDWDCAAGLRCYEEWEYCAPPCPSGACPASSKCQQVNNIEADLCISTSPGCCFGSDCEQCPLEKPNLCAQECCGCADDSQCAADEICYKTNCVTNPCTFPDNPLLCDGGCWECCGDDDCSIDGWLSCMLPDHVCSEEYPLDCSYCDDPYPVSTVINGICACVQCTWDKDCPGDCYCDQEALACACGGPPPGCNQCGESSDCSHPDYGGLLLLLGWLLFVTAITTEWVLRKRFQLR